MHKNLSSLTSLFVEPAFAKLNAIADQNTFRAIREGMVWLLPCLLLHSILFTIAAVLQLLAVAPVLAQLFYTLHEVLLSIIPMLMAGAIGYVLAIKKRLTLLPMALLCPAYVYQVQALFAMHEIKSDAFLPLVAIALPLMVLPILAKLYQYRWTQLSKGSLAGYSVKSALNLVIPSALVSVLLTLVIQLGFQLNTAIQVPFSPHINPHAYPHASGALYVSLNSVLWFLGIHGANVLQGLMTQLNEAAQAGSSFVPNAAFLGSFVFIGGSGATFSLLLATLLFCKNKTLRLLAFASIPIGLFNVNELLLFGLPIILNPRLLIPFIAAPLLNLAISYIAVELQVVSVATAKLDLNLPIGINAYLASDMNSAAVALQILNIMLGMCLYYPFIRYIDKHGNLSKQINLKSLNTTYTQFHEEAALYTYNPIQQAHLLRSQQIKQGQQVQKLSEMAFYLEYQPHICPFTGKFIGCEALIRATDHDGNTIYPNHFLPWLEEAGLLRSLDLWVVQTALAQDKAWQALDVDVSFTINVTADTLNDVEAFATLMTYLARAQGRISIEVSEKSFVGSFERIHAVAHQVHAAGAKVYIDDFGIGYSSLSHLYKYDLDCLKIDRSFVVALATDKGCKIMQVIFNLAQSLDVKVVVEGIESEEQLRKMPTNYIYSVQGWIYSKAIPAHEIPAFSQQTHQTYELNLNDNPRILY
ncbi:MAG TPA: EAL domain-containing protein [Methylophilus sp.]